MKTRMFRLISVAIIILPFMLACDGLVKSVQDTFADPSKKDVGNKEQDSLKIVEEKQVPADSAMALDAVPEEEAVSAVRLNFLQDTTALREAKEALYNLPQFAGKKVWLYRDIHFYENGRVNLKLQNPENPEYVDEYRYADAVWSEPTPVQMSAHMNTKDKRIDLDKIRFETVATIVHNYKEKAQGVEGAKPLTHVYGIVWDSSQLMWYPRNINGSRKRYGIEFTLDGQVKRFQQE